MRFITMRWIERNLKSSAARLTAIIAAIVTLSVGSANAQENAGFVVDEVISKVDNYIVLKSDLDKFYQDHLTNGGSASQQVKCELLAVLVRNKLMMAKAEIDSVVVLDADVDNNTQRRIDMIMMQSGRTQSELEEIYGKPMEQIRAELRDQVKEQLVVNKMQGTITEEVNVTPAEVKKFYNRFPKDSLPYFSASVEIGQIVRIAKSSPQQKQEVKNQLLDIRSRILAGEDFATLAKKYSSDPGVMSNGGNMGWSPRGRMVPQYEAMAFRLKQNEISMPFETEFGFHIMQLLERRGNEYNSRHILISPKPSQEDLNVATKYLDSLRNLIVNDSLKFEKAAKEYSDDTETKGNGGFFTDESGSQRVQIEELDPVIFFKLDSLKPGDISKPMIYRSNDQKDAVRILYYKSRIPPHLASLEEDYNRIQMAALNEKKNRVLEKWFIRARQDVFINIDKNFEFCGILD
jgi:peptidyl-prolyl cis-trans isomerase SurA